MTDIANRECRSSHYFKKTYFRCCRLANNTRTYCVTIDSSTKAIRRLHDVAKNIYSYVVIAYVGERMIPFEKYEFLFKSLAEPKLRKYCWRLGLMHIRGPHLNSWMKKIRVKKVSYMSVLARTRGDCKSFVSELQQYHFGLSGRDAWEMIRWSGFSSRELTKMYNLIMMFSKQKGYVNRQIIESIQGYKPNSQTYLEQYYFSKLKITHRLIKYEITLSDCFGFVVNSYLSRDYMEYFVSKIDISEDNELFNSTSATGWLIILIEFANAGNIIGLQNTAKRLKDCTATFGGLVIYDRMKNLLSTTNESPLSNQATFKHKTMTNSARKLFHEVTGF